MLTTLTVMGGYIMLCSLWCSCEENIYFCQIFIL